MMRSPPPPHSQGSNYGGSPYPGQPQQQQAHNGQGQFAPAFNFGGMVNDQTAQIGFQMGQQAVGKGAEYMESHVCTHKSPPTLFVHPPFLPRLLVAQLILKSTWQLNRYVSIPALKHYFNVTTPYVLRKLLLVLVPWRHKPWTRSQRPSTTSDPKSSSYQYMFLPPSSDLNSPDLYIPTMALVTYILLTTLLAGLRGAFKPEIMGLTATTAFLTILLEILGLKFGTYLLSISNDSQLLDLIAYSGYKFVHIIFYLLLSEALNRGTGTGGWAGWGVWGYMWLANAFFLLRSLKYVLLPDAGGQGGVTVARSQKNRRTQFLFVYSYVVQFAFMWVLGRADAGAKEVAKTVVGRS